MTPCTSCASSRRPSTPASPQRVFEVVDEGGCMRASKACNGTKKAQSIGAADARCFRKKRKRLLEGVDKLARPFAVHMSEPTREKADKSAGSARRRTAGRVLEFCAQQRKLLPRRANRPRVLTANQGRLSQKKKSCVKRAEHGGLSAFAGGQGKQLHKTTALSGRNPVCACGRTPAENPLAHFFQATALLRAFYADGRERRKKIAWGRNSRSLMRFYTLEQVRLTLTIPLGKTSQKGRACRS